jgi:hypothetical protein
VHYSISSSDLDRCNQNSVTNQWTRVERNRGSTQFGTLGLYLPSRSSSQLAVLLTIVAHECVH